MVQFRDVFLWLERDYSLKNTGGLQSQDSLFLVLSQSRIFPSFNELNSLADEAHINLPMHS